MNRLTIRNNDGSYSQPTHTTFEKIFYKLALFEDMMDDLNITDIIQIKHMKIERDNLLKYRDENQKTIAELAVRGAADAIRARNYQNKYEVLKSGKTLFIKQIVNDERFSECLIEFWFNEGVKINNVPYDSMATVPISIVNDFEQEYDKEFSRVIRNALHYYFDMYYDIDIGD